MWRVINVSLIHKIGISILEVKSNRIELEVSVNVIPIRDNNNNNNNNNRYHKRLGACFKFPNGISTNCIMWCIGIVAHCSPV